MIVGCGVGVGVGDGDGVGVGEGVRVRVGAVRGPATTTCVGVAVGTAVFVGLGVSVGVGVRVGVGEGVRVGVGVAVFVGVGVAVEVLVAVAVGGTGVAVGTGVFVAGGGGGVFVAVGLAATHGGWNGSSPLVPVSSATGPAPVWMPPELPSSNTPRIVAEFVIPICGPPQRLRSPCNEIVTELPAGRLHPGPDCVVTGPDVGLQLAPPDVETPTMLIVCVPFQGL